MAYENYAPFYGAGYYNPAPPITPSIYQPMPMDNSRIAPTYQRQGQTTVQQPMTAQPLPVQGNGGLVCVPVTSREEAVATRVEAFGPGYIMPDFGHGMVYYKKFNEKTALADFAEFQLLPDADREPSPAEKKPEMDIFSLVGSFQARFDAIEGKMDALSDKLDKQPRKKIVVKEADEE